MTLLFLHHKFSAMKNSSLYFNSRINMTVQVMPQYLFFVMAFLTMLLCLVHIPIVSKAQTPINNEEVFLRHLYSGKYLCSDKKSNGENFWMWGPIPNGHEQRYIFITQSAGNGKYYLKHKYSGKYLCSDKKDNMGNVWMWGPIPKGHEDRYAFRFEYVGDGRYYIKHVYSGKYLCSGDQDNHGRFWLFGPIPKGHEVRYTFDLIRIIGFSSL